MLAACSGTRQRAQLPAQLLGSLRKQIRQQQRRRRGQRLRRRRRPSDAQVGSAPTSCRVVATAPVPWCRRPRLLRRVCVPFRHPLSAIARPSNSLPLCSGSAYPCVLALAVLHAHHEQNADCTLRRVRKLCRPSFAAEVVAVGRDVSPDTAIDRAAVANHDSYAGHCGRQTRRGRAHQPAAASGRNLRYAEPFCGAAEWSGRLLLMIRHIHRFCACCQ